MFLFKATQNKLHPRGLLGTKMCLVQYKNAGYSTSEKVLGIVENQIANLKYITISPS